LFAVRVSAAIVIFYILGQVVRLYLAHVLKPSRPEAEEVEEGEIVDAGGDSENGIYSNAYAEFDEVEP
jgi:hypothetical protein